MLNNNLKKIKTCLNAMVLWKLFIKVLLQKSFQPINAHSPVLIMHGHRKSPFSHPSPLNRGAQNSFKKFHGLKISSNYFLAKIGINFRKTDNFVHF